MGFQGSKAKTFKGKYEPELEFPEGGGRGVMHNFWNYAFQDKSRQCIEGTRKEKGEE